MRYIRGHNLLSLAKARGEAEREAAVKFRGGWKRSVEIGTAGTPIFGGIFDEDFNQQFKDPLKAVKIYDEMRRTDGTVQAVLLALELPLLQCDWFIKPASADPEDARIAEFVRWNLFENMTTSFRDVLRQALSMHWAGYSLFEKVFEEKEWRGESLIGWRKFAQRLQATISRWDVDEHGGPKGVWQMPPLGAEVYMPIAKLLLFTNRQEGGNLPGLSFLRAAYKHYYMKDRLYRLQAIGFERDVVGVPAIKLPKNASKKDKALAMQIVQNLRRDEKAGVTYPETWVLELLGQGGRNSREEAFAGAIRHHDIAIAKSVLHQIIAMGEGQAGSYALGVSMSDLSTLAQTAQADTVAGAFSDYAIRQLVELNWPNAKSYPKLDHGDIRKKDTKQQAVVLSTLVAAGLLNIDPGVEAYVRQFFGLPQAQPLPGATPETAQSIGLRHHAATRLPERFDAAPGETIWKPSDYTRARKLIADAERFFTENEFRDPDLEDARETEPAPESRPARSFDPAYTS